MMSSVRCHLDGAGGIYDFLQPKIEVYQCICRQGSNSNSKNVYVQIKVGSAQEKKLRYRLQYSKIDSDSILIYLFEKEITKSGCN